MFVGQNDGVHHVWDFVLRMGKNEKSLVLGVLLSNHDTGSRGQVPVESGEPGQGDLANGWECKKKLFPMDIVEPGQEVMKVSVLFTHSPLIYLHSSNQGKGAILKKRKNE